MNGPRGFTANYFDDLRMGVAQGIHCDVTQKIEILFPLGIVDIATLSALQQERAGRL